MNIQKNISLAPFTTFGIGGPADYFFKAQSSQDLIDGIKFAREKNLQLFVLGLGANILVGDKGFRGLVIKNEAKAIILGSEATPESDKKRLSGHFQDNVFLTAESGITIKELIDLCLEKGLSGLEHFAGIPSTLGGALWQNLHFLSPDRKETVYIGDIVESAEILTFQKTQNTQRISESENQKFRSSDTLTLRQPDTPGFPSVMKVARDYFKFSYDYSILHDVPDIVLSATIMLKKEDPKVIQQRIDANLKWREEKHPDYAWRSSAGSVFKKIEGYGAGRLIEQVGLKGYGMGGAKFSEKHANFIVNEKNAKASDIRELIALAQKKVKEKFSLDLQTEISFIGEF